jgi:hypothetical protein
VKRPATARGQTELGWLHSRHTFSFGGYFDPDHMGYRSLRVINDDVVEAGQGFGDPHPRDPHQPGFESAFLWWVRAALSASSDRSRETARTKLSDLRDPGGTRALAADS